NLSGGTDSKEISDLALSRPPILAESSDESTRESPIIGNNFKASIADRDVTWRINTNNDRLFRGKEIRTGNVFPFNPNYRFYYNNQWILEDYILPFEENGFRFSPQ